MDANTRESAATLQVIASKVLLRACSDCGRDHTLHLRPVLLDLDLQAMVQRSKDMRNAKQTDRDNEKVQDRCKQQR